MKLIFNFLLLLYIYNASEKRKKKAYYSTLSQSCTQLLFLLMCVREREREPKKENLKEKLKC